MAKQTIDVAAQSQALIADAREGRFRKVYLLMGDEPYYPELVCRAIVDNCIDDAGKDFNETVCYGADVTAAQVVSAARQFPMMGERVLVVVKDAQNMKDAEALAAYVAAPLDSTVLVLLYRKSGPDKRKALYKACQKEGAVVDSQPLRDYEVPRWISAYYSSRGLQISPEAAALLGESVGTELSTIVVETDKLVRNLPQGTTRVEVADIERNVGVSRQFSVFELTKELSARSAGAALRIASHLGNSAKFQMPMAVSALYTHFSRILRYGALLSSGAPVGPDEKSKALAGVNPYFYREYDTAVRNYPVPKCQQVISMLCEYDYLAKGGDGASTAPGELLVELVSKILTV